MFYFIETFIKFIPIRFDDTYYCTFPFQTDSLTSLIDQKSQPIPKYGKKLP